MGNSLIDALGKALMTAIASPGVAINKFFEDAGKALESATSFDNIAKALSRLTILMPPHHMASGGHIGAGQSAWVGDNPDGSLNSTSELFVPDVAGTIVPSSGAKGTGSRANKPIYVTNHIYNDADMTRFLRDLGWQIGNT